MVSLATALISGDIGKTIATHGNTSPSAIALV